MAARLFLTLIFFSSFFFSIALSRKSSSSSNINWWCNRTPHPGPCKYYIRHSHHHFRPKHRSEFRQMLTQLALEQAFTTQKSIHGYETICKTKNKKIVFTDCVKLYENTIFHLNRTLQGLRKKSCSTFDAQTWLSTALTNLETCSTGALELRVTDFMPPLIYGNVSEMIRNSLAMNGYLLKLEQARNYNCSEVTDDVFPSWVSGSERKLLQGASSIRANLVVAKDGSGHFRTVQAAINAAARRRIKSRFVIHVKRGVYRENIQVDKFNDNIMLVGDGMRYTIISGRRSVQDGFTTYSSATAGIDGLHFIARDITFQNTAGPLKGQAVALRSASDLSVFYRCAIVGYQDTLMVHAQRQFYRECYIYGTIDFIFGNAAVVFQNCMIYARRPLPGQANMITAQGRADPFQNTGISIHNSQIRAAPDLKPVVGVFKTYLGRPWQQYSRVMVMKTFIDSVMSPLGWSPWGNSNFALNTLYYAEYRNFGPGSSTRNRVRWPGFHVIARPSQAAPFTVSGLLGGRTWLPAAGVPFTLGV
ncbi:hypothetical protein L6164_017539 [Bauhinia variegata]|uniref:Uncharacterized protein n=1 Tax=Bauhinia variegata TaxID=167791 RepID=A0ACB9N8F0_BAUVA|nr:hypothetical protein L6164_017539 [Bauhinia variegata]